MFFENNSGPVVDHGMHTYFSGSADEMYYGDVRCEYFAYQDDLGKPSAGVLQAQAAHIKITQLLKEKGLELCSARSRLKISSIRC